MPPEEKPEKSWIPYKDFAKSVGDRFDGTFILNLILQNVNFGLWVMVTLAAQDLFKAYLN